MIKKKKLTHTTAELDDLFTASESHSEEISTLGENLETLEETVTEFIPGTPGTIGQVLTKNAEGNIWTTPVTISSEAVTVQLSVESGAGSVSGVSVTVEVEGISTTTYTTDTSGRCSFLVEGGAIYNITFGEIIGYITPAKVSFRSTITTRTITPEYKLKADSEHVTVLFNYDLSGTSRATSLDVTVGEVTSSYDVIDNKCEFDIPGGSVYTLTYQSVEGYSRPAAATFTAKSESRTVKVFYVLAITSLIWVKLDGSYIPFNDVTAEDYDSLLGIKIATSSLVTNDAVFTIPMAYLIGESTIGSKLWCSNNVLFNGIGCYTNATDALKRSETENNLDGEANTTIIIAEAQSRTLGTTPACSACRALSYTIGGEVKNCFLGSYAQLNAFGSSRDLINSITSSIFGKTVININVGDWWSSTQCSSTGAVYLYYGGFINDTKTNGYQVVPFLAY